MGFAAAHQEKHCERPRGRPGWPSPRRASVLLRVAGADEELGARAPPAPGPAVFTFMASGDCLASLPETTASVPFLSELSKEP